MCEVFTMLRIYGIEKVPTLETWAKKVKNLYMKLYMNLLVKLLGQIRSWSMCLIGWLLKRQNFHKRQYQSPAHANGGVENALWGLVIARDYEEFTQALSTGCPCHTYKEMASPFNSYGGLCGWWRLYADVILVDMHQRGAFLRIHVLLDSLMLKVRVKR